MPSQPTTAAALAAPLDTLAERGVVYAAPAKGRRAQSALRQAAKERGIDIVEIDVAALSLVPGGVVRAMAAEFLGGAGPADEVFCRDAAGDGEGALAAWGRIRSGDASGEPDDPEFEASLRSEAEVRARILAAAGDLSPRLVIFRRAEALDDASARALRALLLGGAGAGWALIVPAAESGPAIGLLDSLRAVCDDDRVPVANLLEIPAGKKKKVGADDADADASSDDAPSLPSKGSSLELLAILSAAPVSVPAAVVGSATLSEYRGRPPRGGWEDLQGLLDAKAAALPGGAIRLRSKRPSPGVVRKADARALRDATAEVLPASDPTRGRLLAFLAAAAGGPDAVAYAIDAATDALARGEGEAAERLLAGAGLGAEAPLLRAQAARLRDDPVAAQRHAEAAVTAGEGLAAHFELAMATWRLGRTGPAQARFAVLADEAEALGAGSLLGFARYAQGMILAQEADHVGAAKIHGDAAKAYDAAGDDLGAARAFARRAVSMAKAGAPDRAVRELRLAMERASDLDDPRPAALDVRILMGVVFREAGSRDKARLALGLAAEKAQRHAAPDREAEACLLAARFHLEGMPARGAERGEALRDGREAAEAAIALARGAGLGALEADAESVLGELAWRSEDWDGASASLDRQALLWERARRPAKEVDVAIRRGRLAGRQGDWETAFRAGVAALTLASKRRLREQGAQAQLLRGEALENLGRGSEALEAFAEAQRVYVALGEGFEAQARAAEQRARQAITNAQEAARS